MAKLVYFDGCRELIKAILVQALEDALITHPSSTIAAHARISALNFLNEKNEMFKFYCMLVNLEPEIVIKKFRKILKHGKRIDQPND